MPQSVLTWFAGSVPCDYWLYSSPFHHVGFSLWMRGHDANNPKKRKLKMEATVLYNLILEMTNHQFCLMISATETSKIMREEWHKAVNIRRP